MSTELEPILRLQNIDHKVDELRREIAALPKHIAEIEKALESHIRRLDADRGALATNQKERKRLEDDIKVQEQKVSKLRDQMLQAKTNEQYRAFQHEIEYCEKEIRKCEDRILDLMGEAEPLEINVKKAETSLKLEKQQVEAEKAQAHTATAKDEKQLAEQLAERETIVTTLKPPTYAAYERVRKKWRGSAVAEVQEGRCTACQITLRPQFFQDLRRSESLMFCESCGRILFYNPPVSFEPDLAAPPVGSQHSA